MQVLCPTCHGNGSIPDPKNVEETMSYCGPNGESVPYIICQTCNGTGFLDKK